MPKKILSFLLSIFVLTSSFLTIVPQFSTTKAGPVNEAINDFDMVEIACDVTSLQAGIPILGTLAQYYTDEREWYDQSFCQFWQKVFDKNNPQEIFGERYTYAQLNWIQNSISAIPYQMLNNIVKAYLKTLVPEWANNNSPVPLNRMSFVTEVYDTLGKFSIVSPVYAQDGGFGFQSNQGLKSFWAASRNMSLILSSLIVVILGFMVMFRVKINPQTAVTVQLAIPRIALTLIGIIFSYAIASFVIDLVFLLLGFVIFFMPAEIFTDPGNRLAAFNFFTKSDFFGMLMYFVSGASILIFIASLISPVIGIIVGFLFLIVIGRIFWKLTTTYFTFILAIILGPWQILFGMLPAPGGGYVGGIGKWIKSLLGHAAVFVILPLMIMVNQVFWNNNSPITALVQQAGTYIAATPGIKGVNISQFPSVPLFTPQGPILGTIFGFVLGLAALAIAPKLADQAKEKISGGKDTYSSAVGEALGAAAGGFGVLQKNLPTGSKVPFVSDALKQGIGNISDTIRNAPTASSTPRPRI